MGTYGDHCLEKCKHEKCEGFCGSTVVDVIDSSAKQVSEKCSKNECDLASAYFEGDNQTPKLLRNVQAENGEDDELQKLLRSVNENGEDEVSLKPTVLRGFKNDYNSIEK